MEEFLLCALFASNELDIVDQQHVDAPIFSAKLLVSAGADGVDELVCELLGGDVEDPQAAGNDLLADGVQQMRLAQSDAAIEEERVIGLARLLSHPLGGCMGELAARTDNKRLEGIFLV